MKIKKWSPVKEILFIYLAINKIMYWFSIIMGMEQFSFAGGGRVILERFLTQDLAIIACITVMYYFDWRIKEKRTKYNIVVEHAILYGIGYVAFLGLIFTSNAFNLMILLAESITWSEYISLFAEHLIPFTIAYLIASVGLEIKLYFKKKGQKTSEELVVTQDTECKLSMLKILLDDGILSQEEFEDKKKLLYS